MKSIIIWAEFVQTRVGCSKSKDNFRFAAYDQFSEAKTGSKLGPMTQPYLPLALALPNLSRCKKVIFMKKIDECRVSFY